MKTKRQIKLSVLMDKLCDLGWEYTCNRMSRSGMQTYDEILQYVGALESHEPVSYTHLTLPTKA